jgi:hypothetical protein
MAGIPAVNQIRMADRQSIGLSRGSAGLSGKQLCWSTNFLGLSNFFSVYRDASFLAV